MATIEETCGLVRIAEAEVRSALERLMQKLPNGTGIAGCDVEVFRVDTYGGQSVYRVGCKIRVELNA